MKKVITLGVFDLFHLGHLRLFQNIKNKVGKDAYLIVAIQNDDFIKKFKPEAQVLYNQDERFEMVSSLKIVDEVVTYNEFDDIINRIDFDIWAKGCEQGGANHKPFNNLLSYCEQNNKTVLTMPRTEGISSTYYKRIIENGFK